MKKSPLVQVGNPILRKKARLIDDIQSTATHKLVQKLIAVMREHDLVGISAPQIGVSKRVFVSEIRKTRARPYVRSEKVHVFVNPRICAVSKRTKGMYEGCGSVLHGELFARVERHLWVTIEYNDEHGVHIQKTLRGLAAHIAQHEIDHLNGILFLDRVVDTRSYITRQMFRERKLQK